MTILDKTDNGNVRAKLDLRRYFLNKYHLGSSLRVLDCCQGAGVLWKELREEYRPDSYVGLDIKPGVGRLKIDSAKFLKAGGWDFNCIDIDTYGRPWKHWFAVLEHIRESCTVFMTAGLLKGLMSSMTNKEMEVIGLTCPTILSRKIPTITRNLGPLVDHSCLALAAEKGCRIQECLEAEHTRATVRYFGIRLEVIGCH